MKKIKFKFSKTGAKKLISIVLKYRRLLFFIFFSALLAFTFGFMYKYIYIGTNFPEYEESYESRVMLDIKTNDRILKETLKNIEQRNERLKKESVDYNNPFKFMDSNDLKTNEDDNNDIDNINGIYKETGNNKENNLISPPPLNTP